jgi:threonine/homoserine/homoserine lactone efflux protein
MLGSAVGIAISPLPIIAMVLMLATPRGRANGAAFTAGWVIALAAIATLIVAVGGESESGGKTSNWVYWVKLAIGVLFLLLAAKQWQGRPRAGGQAPQPKWMAVLDTVTPAKASGLAVLLSAANPKNLALTVGASVTIASSPASPVGKGVAVALFVVIASLCVLVPLGVYLLGGQRATAVLDEWRLWLGEHNNAIMAVVLLVLGAKFVGEAVSGL